jgi:hypothetical protein
MQLGWISHPCHFSKPSKHGCLIECCWQIRRIELVTLFPYKEMT